MELTLEQAISFCEQRRWFVTKPPSKVNYCDNCKTDHPIAVDMMVVGIINKFKTEQEFIDWVKKLIPNSI